MFQSSPKAICLRFHVIHTTVFSLVSRTGCDRLGSFRLLPGRYGLLWWSDVFRTAFNTSRYIQEIGGTLLLFQDTTA